LGDNQDAFLDLKEKLKSLPCNDMMIGRPDLTAAVHGGPKAYFFSITV
jgi:hypothetical protein